MFCPLKFNEKTLDSDGAVKSDLCWCEETNCALWEQFTSTCALATVAIMRGKELSVVSVKERR